MTRKEFGMKVSRCREAIGCGVALLAEHAKVSRSSVYKIERGEKVRRNLIDAVVAALKSRELPLLAAAAKVKMAESSTANLRNAKGRNFFTTETARVAGRLGGQAIASKRGVGYLRSIASRGGLAKASR